MRDNDELEADFVKKLMHDIFDNPVKRMYHVAKKDELADGNVTAKVISLFGEMSDEKKQVIFDAL